VDRVLRCLCLRRRHRKRSCDGLGDGFRVSTAWTAKHLNRRAEGASQELSEGSAQVMAVLRTYKNATRGQIRGRVAEPHHAATFNADAHRRGRPDLRAHLTHPHAPEDIVVRKAGQIERRAQVKYEWTPVRNSAAIAHPKYHGQQRIIPAEHVESAEWILSTSSARAARNCQPKRALSRADAARNVTDRLEVEGVQSDPLTSKGAMRLAKDPNRLQRRGRALELKGAAQKGAIAGALFGGIGAGVQNAMSFANGQKSGGEAVLDTVKTVAMGSVEGAVLAVGGTFAKRGMARAGLKGLARRTAPLAVAQFGLDMAGDAAVLMAGEISGSEFARRTGKNLVKGTSTWLAAEVGAAIGTALCPGFGTFLGGLIGGVLGSLAGDAIV